MKYRENIVFAMKSLVLLFLICISQAVVPQNKLKPQNEKITVIKPNPTHPSDGPAAFPFMKEYENFRFKNGISQGDNPEDLMTGNTEILESQKPQTSKEEGEQEAFPSTAIAGSEYSVGYWGWSMVSYGACNAISGRSTSFWLSKPNVKDDSWEAVFDEPQKIDLIEINWLYPPKNFKVYFKLDDSSDYIALSQLYEKIKYHSDIGMIANQYSFNQWNTIVFQKPIFAKRIRFALNEPLERYRSFAIYKVKFFQKMSSFMIKNESINNCINYCLFVNTDKPRENIIVEAFPCIQAIVMGNNQELFTYGVRRDLRYYNNKEFCIGFNGANEVALRACSSNDPAYKVQINKDGSFSFIGSADRCIYVDDNKSASPNFVEMSTEITVTSQADDASYKKDNIKIDGQSFWNSAPGDKRVIMQIFFGKIMDEGLFKGQYEIQKIDQITIDWVKAPKKFLIYTWKPGYSWVLRFAFDNYHGNKSEISMTGQEASAIMIDMAEGYPDEALGGLVSFGISQVYIGTNSMKVKTISCSSTALKYKLFDFEIQSYKKIERTPEYNKVMKDISISFERLVNIFKNLLGLKVLVPKVKSKANEFRRKIISIRNTVGKSAAKELGSFKSDILGTFANPKFLEKLEIRGETTFINTVKTRNVNIVIKPGSSENPSDDCDQIFKKFPGARSGYYYIKPACSSSPIRVFCDFTIEKPADIFVFNNYSDEPNTDLSYLNIRNPEDIQMMCGKLGLQPIQLTTKKMVNRIYQILLAMGYNLSKPMGVPLGYDYTCDASKKCSEIFNSLNDKQTPPLGFLFSGRTKSIVKGPFVGLGNSPQPSRFTFDVPKTPITALICSTNSHVAKDGENFEILYCDTTADKGDIFEDNTTVLVRCPKCVESPAPVYGTKIYGANSSVCRAAIHSGISTSSGGKFFITKLSEYKKSAGSTDLGVTTMDTIQTTGSFTLKEYTPDCPYSKSGENDEDDDDDDTGSESFLETEEKLTEATKSIFEDKELQAELNNLDSDNTEMENLFNDRHKESSEKDFKFKEKIGGFGNFAKGLADKVKGAAGKAANDAATAVSGGGGAVGDTLKSNEDQNQAALSGIGNIIDQGQKLANSGLEEVNKFAGEVGNQVNNLLKTGQSEAKAATDFVDNAVSDGGPKATKAPDPVDPIARQEEPKSANEQCTPITEYEIKKLEEIRKSADYEYLSLIRKKTKAMKKLISFYLKALAFAKPESKLSLINTAKNFGNCFKLKLDAQNAVKDIKDKALARISRTAKLAKGVMKDLQKMTRLNPVVVDYKLPPDELVGNLYTIWDTKSKDKSNWNVHRVGINKRKQAVGNTSLINTGKQLSASMLTLKGKNYFDLSMTVDVLVKAQGVSGVVFRVVDAFNYYAIVFNPAKKFKAIYKVRNGEEKILTKVDDGGIVIDNWHNIKITATTSSIKVEMINLEANGASPQILLATDNTFSQGTAGVFVNGLQGFYFDNMRVDPLPCWVPFVPIDGLEIIKPNSSILQEDFRGALEDWMTIIDPEVENKGPSKWMFNTNEKPGMEVGILQNSEIYDTSFQRKPDMAVYKDKIITNGILKVRLIGKDADGTVSVILKYKKVIKDGMPQEKFYSFDLINSETNPKFVLRKFSDGSVSELASVSKKIDGLPTLGYIAEKKILVEVQFIVDSISISVSMNNSPMIKVLEAKDDSIDYGAIGFGTYRTKAAFIMVELFPPRLKFSEADLNQIMQSNLDYIPMPDVKKIYDAAKTINVTQISGGITYVIYASNALGSTQGLDLRKEDSLKNREKSELWHTCANARTKEDKDNYCMKQFQSKGAIHSCKANFCDVCCAKTSNPFAANSIHQCKKSCYRTEIAETSNDEYKEVCINSVNPTQSIYNYCNERMKDFDKSLLGYCKLDMCNLCCVTMDRMRNKSFSSFNMTKCFEDCAEINDNSHTVDQILIKDFNDKPLKGPSSLAYNKEDNVLYFTDAGTFLNVSLYPSNGSLYMIDLDSKIMRPIMHNCLSFPSDVVYENKKGIIYVAETLANRIIRLTQNPYGVYHSSVFYQFNGRLGPTAMAVDESGNLYVARYEFQIGLDGNDYDGIISVINRHGRLIGELIIPNLSEITGLLISSKKKEILYMTEKNSNHVYAIKLSSFLGELDKIDEMNKVFNYN